MGDIPIAYVEGAGGTRVSEDEIVAVGKHDVSFFRFFFLFVVIAIDALDLDLVVQGWAVKCRRVS